MCFRCHPAPCSLATRGLTRWLGAALRRLPELEAILDILLSITKDTEPDSRMSLARQLPTIVKVRLGGGACPAAAATLQRSLLTLPCTPAQSVLKHAATLDDACTLLCDKVHPALEALLKDEGEAVRVSLWHGHESNPPCTAFLCCRSEKKPSRRSCASSA